MGAIRHRFAITRPSVVRMPASSPRSSAKRAAKPPRREAKSAAPDLGSLPEWNLADLYPAIDAPEIKRDLDRAGAECTAFEKAYKGRLAELAGGTNAGQALAEAVRRYEAIEDLIGRLISYAGLVYS